MVAISFDTLTKSCLRYSPPLLMSACLWLSSSQRPELFQCLRGALFSLCYSKVIWTTSNPRLYICVWGGIYVYIYVCMCLDCGVALEHVHKLTSLTHTTSRCWSSYTLDLGSQITSNNHCILNSHVSSNMHKFIRQVDDVLNPYVES